MDSTLVEIFEHNLWSNLRLLDVCAGLTPAQLRAASKGTYGRLQDTLVHLLAAEEWYVTILSGHSPEQPLRVQDGFPGIDALRERARSSGRALIELAAKELFNETVRMPNGEKPRRLRAIVPLIQAIHHATEHRTQINTILGQQGIEPPSISGWAYGEAMKY